MNFIRSIESGNGSSDRAHRALPADRVRAAEPPNQRALIQPDRIRSRVTETRVRYGLPCAQCRTYFRADLLSCPVCQSTQRVSAGEPDDGEDILGEEAPDEITDQHERERFLREFESERHSLVRMNTAATFRCTLEENHRGTEPAPEVCRGCYDRLRERVDLMEAALHMDLKEAAQIVYAAVWADPHSDKTYQNAAQAILTELRRRSGITLVPFQQFRH